MNTQMMTIRRHSRVPHQRIVELEESGQIMRVVLMMCWKKLRHIN